MKSCIHIGERGFDASNTNSLLNLIPSLEVAVKRRNAVTLIHERSTHDWTFLSSNWSADQNYLVVTNHHESKHLNGVENWAF